ncbi:hypothetical protein ACTXT7_005590 [Hymenolepis weldensis]
MSPDVINASKTTGSLNPIKYSTKVLPAATPAETANGDMKLQASARDSIKATNLSHSIESSNPKIVPTQLVSEPTLPKQQSVPKFHLQRAPKSSTKIEFLKRPGQCNHIRVKPMLVRRAKQSVLFDDKCEESEKICLAKPPTLANGTVSNATVQNISKAALSYHEDLMYSQTKVSWSHINLSLAKPIQRISYLILVEMYSNWPEIILIKSTSIGSVITSLRQVLDDASCRCPNLDALSETSPFSARYCIFRTKNGSNGDLPGPVLLPFHMIFRNSGDPAQSSARSLFWTLQKTLKRIQNGYSVHTNG